MANYFCDFVNSLSSHMIPLAALTKKRSTSEPFKMTQDRASFFHIKGLLAKSSQLDIMITYSLNKCVNKDNRRRLNEVAKWY